MRRHGKPPTRSAITLTRECVLTGLAGKGSADARPHTLGALGRPHGSLTCIRGRCFHTAWTRNGSRGQPNADWRELNDGQILSGEFVISGRDTPHFRCSAHDVFDIYAIDYSPLSANFFWGGPCEAAVFAERLSFNLLVILPKSISVIAHFVANKGGLLLIQQSLRKETIFAGFLDKRKSPPTSSQQAFVLTSARDVVLRSQTR